MPPRGLALIRQSRALIALLWILGALAYANTFTNAFQLDDFHVITENVGIRSVHPVWRHFTDASTMSSLESNRSYRPLLPLTLSLSYALHGLSVWGYHLFNLVCHLLAATVFYVCFARLLSFRAPASLPRARVRAALAAGLFVVHPISGMSVNYPSGRDNLILQLFLAVALLCYVRLRQEGDRPALWLGALAAYAGALFSKTPALIFPLVVALFELVIARHPCGRRAAGCVRSRSPPSAACIW